MMALLHLMVGITLHLLERRVNRSKSVTTFSKSSIPLMRADTQFAVVDATLKGYNKWVSAHGKTPQQDVRICFYFILFYF